MSAGKIYAVLISLLLPCVARMEDRDKIWESMPSARMMPFRCECVHHIESVGVKNIADITVLGPDSFCSKTQIMLTLKQGQEVCLNPDSAQGRKLLDCWRSYGNNGAKTKRCLRKKKVTR